MSDALQSASRQAHVDAKPAVAADLDRDLALLADPQHLHLAERIRVAACVDEDPPLDRHERQARRVDELPCGSGGRDCGSGLERTRTRLRACEIELLDGRGGRGHRRRVQGPRDAREALL
jgi:hypothetical protein